MLAVISPAKRLNWDVAPTGMTSPDFLDDARILAGHARQLSLTKLKSLMNLSDDLARLNRDRFAAMKTSTEAVDTRPAALAFAGDTYQGLEAASLDAESMTYAQRHLRILSGLYGLLRPMDRIEAYRLEMGSRLASRRGKTLYAFWGDRLSVALNDLAERAECRALVNCASQEYFSAVDREKLRLDVIAPQFLENKDGTLKVVSFFAKRARGAMARFVMENRVQHAADLAAFDLGGYAFDPGRSTPDSPVFTRPYEAARAA